jgi:hypothetical protein
MVAHVQGGALPPGIQPDFIAALDHVGFDPNQRNAIIEASGCINIAMLGVSK